MIIVGYEFKSGNYNGYDYAFYDVYYTVESYKVTGLKTGVVRINAKYLDDAPVIGSEFRVFYNRFGKVAQFNYV